MSKYGKIIILCIPGICITLIALLVATIALAQTSLPGNYLYGIKTMSENVRLALSFSNTDKIKTHISIAKEKINELEELSVKNVSGNLIEKTEIIFNENQLKAKEYIKDHDDNSKVIEWNKNLNENLDRNNAALLTIMENIPETNQEGIKEAIEKSKNIHKNYAAPDTNIKQLQKEPKKQEKKD